MIVNRTKDPPVRTFRFVVVAAFAGQTGLTDYPDTRVRAVVQEKEDLVMKKIRSGSGRLGFLANLLERALFPEARSAPGSATTEPHAGAPKHAKK